MCLFVLIKDIQISQKRNNKTVNVCITGLKVTMTLPINNDYQLINRLHIKNTDAVNFRTMIWYQKMYKNSNILKSWGYFFYLVYFCVIFAKSVNDKNYHT